MQQAVASPNAVEKPNTEDQERPKSAERKAKALQYLDEQIGTNVKKVEVA